MFNFLLHLHITKISSIVVIQEPHAQRGSVTAMFDIKSMYGGACL